MLLPLWTPLGLATISIMSLRTWLFVWCSSSCPDIYPLGSKRLLATLNVNTMIYWLKSLELSATRASETTEYMLFCISSHLLVMRAYFTLFCATRFVYACNRLREMDIELMRRLSPRVNVIPVIGKADSLTPSELKGFKKRVCY